MLAVQTSGSQVVGDSELKGQVMEVGDLQSFCEERASGREKIGMEISYFFLEACFCWLKRRCIFH